MTSLNHRPGRGRALGMGAPITRRDFLNGVAVAVNGNVAGGLLPGLAATGRAAVPARQDSAGYYPPTLTGDEAGVRFLDGPRRREAARSPHRAWSTAPHGGPLAGALAPRSRPISRTATIGQPTAAVRPLTTTDDNHADRPAAAHSTVQVIA